MESFTEFDLNGDGGLQRLEDIKDFEKMYNIADVKERMNHYNIPKDDVYYDTRIPRILLWDGRFSVVEALPILMFPQDEMKSVLGNKPFNWEVYKQNTEKVFQEQGALAVMYKVPTILKISVFNEMIHEIEETEIYDLFKEVYKTSEYGFEELDWEYLIEVCRANNTSDIERFKREYGNKVKVYRGVATKSSEYGLSWTTDIDVAKMFATRFNSKGYILEGNVESKDILTAFETEGEILVKRENVKNIRRIMEDDE